MDTLQKFTVNLACGVIRGDRILSDCSRADLLFLHGAGAANRARFQGIRTRLSEKYRISSTAFDYLGHGDSTENALPDSLRSRTEQAREVIERIHQTERLSLAASSMSAYTALKLTEKYQVADLILLVPAVYHRDAYLIPFGSGFSRIIRHDSSWVNSDAWSIMEAYTGNLLIIAAEHDEVIPREVIGYLYAFACNAKSRKIYFMPGAPHRILEFIMRKPDRLKYITDEMNQIIFGGEDGESQKKIL